MPGPILKGQANKSRKKSKRNILLVLLLILIASVVGGKYYYDDQTAPVAENNIKEIEILIPKGSSTTDIANLLKRNNLIKNKYVFRFLAKIENKDEKFKAGKYVLNNGMTPKEIINELVNGNTVKETVKFTIPEGYEIRQIAEKLSGQGLIDKVKFLELCNDVDRFTDDYSFLKDLPEGLSLEGYLFPDTYEVYKNTNEENIIRKMLDRFNEVYTEDIRKKAKELNLDTNQVITLASLIEREAMVDSERKLVSAVFHNRLKKGMKLQSCATVQYILGERKEHLTYDDLKIESKYNTYLYNGLPPGPIASPGIKSIKAAVNPANVDYLYFVSNGDGTHFFTNNYNEFLKVKHRN